MNIMEVMELPIGSVVTNTKGTEYELKKCINGKCLVNKEGKYIVQIDEFTFKEKYNMVKNFKRGDKVYIDWFADTEGLDEVEFLCYCEDENLAQILIKGTHGFFIRKVEVNRIYNSKQK